MHEPTDVGAMRLILTGLAATTMLATPLGAQIATPKLPTPIGYPATRTGPVVDDDFGTLVADPYRWFETPAAESNAWAARQTAFGARFYRDAALRPWVVARLREATKPLDEIEAKFVSADGVVGVRLAPSAGGTHKVLVVSDDAKARPRMLLDPVRLGRTLRIARFHIAKDQRHVIVELADGGSDWKQARVVRVADGTLLPERVEGLLFSESVWTRDGLGFFCVQYHRPDVASRVMFTGAAVRYHTLGEPTEGDRTILQMPAENSDVVLNVSVAGDGRYAFLTEGSTAESDEIGWLDARVHVLELGTGPTPSLGAPLQSLSPSRDAAYRIVRVSGRLLTVLTDRGAPRHRLVEIDLDQPAPAHWREVIPESPHVLQSVRVIGGRFAAIYLRDAQQYVKVFTLTGAPVRDIEAPPVSRVFVEAGAADSLLEVESEGYLQLPTVIQHDVTNGSTTPVFSAKSAFPMHEFLASQVWYTSRDGTRIPMFLVHRKGIALNGTHPTLLFGYGASGTSTLPGYSPDVLTWLQMGGVFAVPTLRGGGEFGRDWYESAALEGKQNTFDDFIGAAEYLIAQGYTTAARLAIKGESNGGQLVAAVMVQRPELFAVAVPGVPQTDNLRYDRGRHRGQFGSPADSLQFSFLYAYSPLHRVRAGTCYPATLVTTAMNDDRSPAWMSMKFVAALQAAQACPRPVVVLARERGGHFGERTPDGAIQDAADVLLFIAKQLGMSQPPR